MSDRRGKKRPKSFYRKSSHSKRQRLNTLSAGMRGFLVTCNFNEKQAVRESYNILNEYADELYGTEQVETKKTESDGSGSEEEDMEKAMAKEVKALKEQQAVRRFQNTETNAKNCVFIRTTLEDPVELHNKIFNSLYETKVNKARFIMRMLPISGSCKANLDDIKDLAEEILPKYFPSQVGKERTFSVIFKTRNNSGVSRDSVMSLLGELVKSLNPLNRVHCDNPDVAIIVEIICSICCLGVCTDFYKFRKCNMHEVVKDPSKPEADLKSANPVAKGKTEQVSKTEASESNAVEAGEEVKVEKEEQMSKNDASESTAVKADEVKVDGKGDMSSKDEEKTEILEQASDDPVNIDETSVQDDSSKNEAKECSNGDSVELKKTSVGEVDCKSD